MTEGFILSNKYRKIIFDAFASGETRVDHITKKYHIIPAVAQRVITELLNQGIIEKHDDEYQLTAEGEKLKLNL